MRFFSFLNRFRSVKFMPKKPEHPTIYPTQTRSSAIASFATIIATGAVRMAKSEEIQTSVEPEIEQDSVNKQTSVCYTEIEMRSTALQLEMDI